MNSVISADAETKFMGMAMNVMKDGVMLVDENTTVVYANPKAVSLLNIDVPYTGISILDAVGNSNIVTNNSAAGIKSMLTGQLEERDIHRSTRDGKDMLITLTPYTDSDGHKFVLIVMRDATLTAELEKELDIAFSLSLPSPKVVKQLQSIKEYVDSYHDDTKLITITEVIQNGGYRHISNCLKIYATLISKGVDDILGIRRDVMVKAITLHDIGKSQPDLKVGDTIDPKDVFEDGKEHAKRSADIAKYTLGETNTDVLNIIFYHHHSQKELPGDFPSHLFPMWRLFHLIDGLSAAITRGKATFDLEVKGSVITVTEYNQRPVYNGTKTLDLYTGKQDTKN